MNTKHSTSKLNPKNDVFSRFALLLVAILLVLASTQFFKLSRSPNFLPDSHIGSLNIQADEALADKQTLYEQLEFMVWETDRKSLASSLAQKLQADLNSNPFNSKAWLELTFVGKFSDGPTPDRVFALERALSLSRWNATERVKLTHHCVNEYKTFQQSAKGLCDQLISKLPNGLHLPVLASQLGVSRDKLEYVLKTHEQGIQ